MRFFILTVIHWHICPILYALNVLNNELNSKVYNRIEFVLERINYIELLLDTVPSYITLAHKAILNQLNKCWTLMKYNPLVLIIIFSNRLEFWYKELKGFKKFDFLLIYFSIYLSSILILW